MGPTTLEKEFHVEIEKPHYDVCTQWETGAALVLHYFSYFIFIFIF